MVAVLWILGALSTLASIYAVYVVNSAAAFAATTIILRAEALVSAALELTAYQQQAALHNHVQPAANSAFTWGKRMLRSNSRSEAARIDLNAAPKQLLVGLFRALGARPKMQRFTVIESSPGERLSPSDQDSEISAYRMARLGYQPRGG